MARHYLPLLQEFTQKFAACDNEDVLELVVQVTTESSALTEIYRGLSAKFPSLFEMLLLNYRWFPSRVAGLRLLANPPGKGLSGFLKEITRDGCLYEVCISDGYLQFALAEDVSYDPICFDFKKRSSPKVALVRLDHEEILCRERIRVKEIVAESFEEFVCDAVSGRFD